MLSLGDHMKLPKISLIRQVFLFCLLTGSLFTLWATNKENPMKTNAKFEYTLTEEEWKAKLTPLQFQVARESGTERSFTGEYVKNKEDGVYHCVGCDLPLYDSKTKFESGTGWPSYYEAIIAQNVREFKDGTLGMERVEIVCNRCGSHLGHVFPDGPQPSGMRHCVNSASLTFKKR